jgi:hypothetical protein
MNNDGVSLPLSGLPRFCLAGRKASASRLDLAFALFAYLPPACVAAILIMRLIGLLILGELLLWRMDWRLRQVF